MAEPPVEVQSVRISNLAKLSRPTGYSLFLNLFPFIHMGQAGPHFNLHFNLNSFTFSTVPDAVSDVVHSMLSWREGGRR